MPRDYIVKDSSIWQNDYAFAAKRHQDANLKIGIVRQVIFPTLPTDDVRYLVEVTQDSVNIPITCSELQKYGGVFNYEEFIYHGYTPTKGTVNQGPYNTKAGDLVVVAYLNGDAREGLIIGAIKHTARVRELSLGDGQSYISEFNGLQTSINSNGEYTITFRGVPTNIASLNTPPNGAVINAPTYNTTVGSSFMKFDMSGGITFNDNANSNPQFLQINKSAGTLTIASGSNSIAMNKGAGSLNMTASSSTNISAPKIAIGSGGTELLDQISQALSQLISCMGDIQAITVIGNLGAPTSTPLNSGSFAGIQSALSSIQSAINSIKGNL